MEQTVTTAATPIITRTKIHAADKAADSSDRLMTGNGVATWTVFADGTEIGTLIGRRWYPIDREAHSCYPRTSRWSDIRTAIERTYR